MLGSTLVKTLLEYPSLVAACWTTGLFVQLLFPEKIFWHGIVTQNVKAPLEAENSGVKETINIDVGALSMQRVVCSAIERGLARPLGRLRYVVPF